MSAARRKRGSAQQKAPAVKRSGRSARRKPVAVQLEPGAVDALKRLAADKFAEEIGKAVADTARAIRRRHGSVRATFDVDIKQTDDERGYVVTEPAGPVHVTLEPGDASDLEEVLKSPERLEVHRATDRPFVPRPPKPAAHVKGLGEFCEHLNAHRPFAAKIIDEASGAMLVYCEDVNVYFRNTPHALRALRHYGVQP